MRCRERLEQLLNEERVPYRVREHRPAVTAQDIASVEHLSGYEMAKVVMVVADDRLVMLVVPAPHRVDLDKVRRALSVTAVRLAEEEEFVNVFGDCEVGAMPPFGHLYGIAVYLDPALARRPEIVFNAGSHRETITMAYQDYARLARPEVIDLSTSPKAKQPVGL
ncbi:MAG: YbaK/EbsC family protein [Armatimonadetes bacterium]|nr:YbaK/EbsC family protein [Armatimonadota bacterium]MBI2972645.1 YbaK/EbsC family protein [Armatimonadota bacterium]